MLETKNYKKKKKTCGMKLICCGINEITAWLQLRRLKMLKSPVPPGFQDRKI